MAALYTEITLEDMDRFLKRAYRALRPKQKVERGEYVYDLNLSKGKILIKVWTSIHKGSGLGAQKGEDAIRVVLVTQGGRPLMPKGKIVKRTQNWRNSLQDRIEELLETYEAKTEYWKGRQVERDNASPDTEDAPRGEKPRRLPGNEITEPQIKYLQFLGSQLRNKGKEVFFPLDAATLGQMTRDEASKTIGRAKFMMGKYADSMEFRVATRAMGMVDSDA